MAELFLELGNAGDIQRVTVDIAGQRVNFYAHRKHRYLRRELKSMLRLLERIFDPEFAHAVGRHGELMFDSALGRRGFQAVVKNTNSWKGLVWTKTNQNLDRIITRNDVACGVEIKNTQNYIPRAELQQKMAMCAYLKIIPLFIMRFAPKSYNFEIYRAGGFSLLFEEQMYPWGHKELLHDVRQQLGLKINSPRDVKEGDIQRFLNWHEKRFKPW